jgi:hypothetical protein
LRARAAVALPVKATLERWGLRLKSPEATFVGPWLAVGPQQEGLQLRTVLVGAGGERRELTSVLPEQEQVAESTMVLLDGRPTLVVGSFRGLGVLSRKRLRVFALVGEAGSPPRRPMLARELAARAWQTLAVQAGDLDRDGRDDLAVLADDGLGGGEVRVSVFRGIRRRASRGSPRRRGGGVAGEEGLADGEARRRRGRSRHERVGEHRDRRFACRVHDPARQRLGRRRKEGGRAGSPPGLGAARRRRRRQTRLVVLRP